MSEKKRNLFIVNTPYHLMLSCNMYQSGDVLVCVGNFEVTKVLQRLIDITFGPLKFETHNFYYYRSALSNLPRFRSDIKQLKNKLSEYYFTNIFTFNDVDPITQWLLKNLDHSEDVILVEEGIGLYRDTVKRHEFLFRIAGKILFGGSFENVKRIGESTAIDTIMCNSDGHLSSAQKKKNILKMIEVDYTRLASRVGIEQIVGCDWFIGQPLVEDGVMTEDEYLTGISAIYELSRKQNRKLVLKPHPREKVAKYNGFNIEIIENQEIPVEMLIGTENKVNVYTYYSSAIINLAQIRNIQGYAIYHAFGLNEKIPQEIFEEAGAVVLESLDTLTLE